MHLPHLMIVLAITVVMALITTTAMAQKKPMSCKLKSERVIEGKERKCLYVCEDKSLEGRTRNIDSTCPRYISSSQ